MILSLTSCSTEKPAENKPSSEDASILNVTDAYLDESSLTLRMLVDHKTDLVSLSDKVVVTQGCNWSLYRGETEIRTKIAAGADGELNDGDNLFYIVVSNPSSLKEKTYTLTIHRSFAITVSYYFQNLLLDQDNAYTGYPYELKKFQDIPGYTFKHWTNDAGETVEVETPWENLVFYANASANTYTVTLNPNGGHVSNTLIEVEYDREYSLPTPEKLGYVFDGWYDGNKRIGDKGVWNYSSNLTLIAHWNIITYKITYVLYGGTNPVSNPSTYTVQSPTINLASPVKTGYAFVGWTNGTSLITSIPAGSTGDLTLTANWKGNTYTIVFDPNGGSCSISSINVIYGDSYSLPAPTRRGYSFDGWYNGSSIISNSGTWNYTSSLSLIAHWSIISYNIYYKLNGGTNNSSNPLTYTVEDNITLFPPTKTGYTFAGWFNNNGNQITQITAGTTGALTLNARWSANLNILTVTSEDPSKGTVEVTSGSGYSGESITVVATPINNCFFKGWYHKSTKVSNQSIYTFDMPTNDYSLMARFLTKEEKEKEEELAIKHATRPIISEDSKTVVYGLYPQTNVDDQSLLLELDSLTEAQSNGWYLYNEEYYAKTYASPHEDYYQFDNGSTIEKNTNYWFKCEPIIWNVLSNDNGICLLLSSMLLDCHAYNDRDFIGLSDGHYASNYEKCEIRRWINDYFFNTAFGLENSHIQTTMVGNGHEYPRYTSSNTFDKVFLLNKWDYKNSAYGFPVEDHPDDWSYCSERTSKTTDWARARGSISFSGYGEYWSRTPGPNGMQSCPDNTAYVIWYEGWIGYSGISSKGTSVRPAITVDITYQE